MTDTTLVRPENSSAVVDAVKAATAARKTIEIIGGGTKRGLGHAVSADIACDLTGLSGISLLEPEELVMTVASGTPVAEIEAALAETGQQLAFEPPDMGAFYGGEAGKHTIGGVIACNLSGPRRVAVGAARDHFLGFEAVTGFGETIKAGGRVVKNVTGYDLCKLFAGSYGTLAIMTKVTLKVLPIPERQATVIVTGADDKTAVALLRKVLNQPLEISGAVHLPAWAVTESAVPEIQSLGGSVTAVRIEGFDVSVEDRIARLRRSLAGHKDIAILDQEPSKRFWTDMRNLGPCVRRSADHVWRISVPPTQGAEAVEAIQRQIKMDAYYDWSGGLIWGLLPTLGGACDGPIRAAAEAAGGHATLMRAPETLRAETPVFHPIDPGKAALVSRIKASFDPDSTFNPGRMYRGA